MTNDYGRDRADCVVNVTVQECGRAADISLSPDDDPAAHLLAVAVRASAARWLLGARQRVDEGVLDEREEDEHHAHRHPDVDRLRVGDARDGRLRAGQLRRHRQHGGDAERDARRHRVHVDPEGDPREDDDQDRRHVRLEEEESVVAPQREARHQSAELACVNSKPCASQLEAARGRLTGLGEHPHIVGQTRVAMTR